MQEYLDYMSQHPEEEHLTYQDIFFGEIISDEIEIYNWEER